MPDPAAYQAERRELQRAYIERLKADNHLRHSAGNEPELANLLLRLKDELKALREREERIQRHLIEGQERLEGTVAAAGRETHEAIEGLGRRFVQALEITPERIRAHLLEAVEDGHRRDLAQAEQGVLGTTYPTPTAL